MDLHRLRRAVVIGFVAAALWGLLSAAITRLLMRAVTLLTRGAPDFTWVGTIGIAVAYVVVLTPGAIALAYSGRRWSRVLFGLCAAYLAYTAVVIGIAETSSHALGLTAWRWAGLIAVLLAMLAVYTAQVVLVYRTASRAVPDVTAGVVVARGH